MLARLGDAVRRNPYPLYAVLRRIAPVLRLRAGVWAVFDHESVRTALHDPARFSSRASAPGGSPLDWLIFLDPPRHTRLRALIARTFTPRAIAELAPRIEAITHELLDGVVGRGELDLVSEFAERLPLRVILELMGIPTGDADRVGAWSDAIIGLGDTIAGGARAARAVAAYRDAKAEMLPYLQRHIAERRDEPRRDLLSALVGAEVDGARLTDEEILGFFQLVLLAGTETTTNLISNAVLVMLEHPAECAAIRADPALVPAAIEEVMRFRSPVQMVFRSAVSDVTLRGRTIPAGALVLVMVGSANRDGRSVSRPNEFDPRRPPQMHAGFGHGIHFCIGAALGRLEARVALTALLARLPDLARADGGGWRPCRGINVLGPRQLRLRFTPS